MIKHSWNYTYIVGGMRVCIATHVLNLYVHPEEGIGWDEVTSLVWPGMLILLQR